MFTPARPEKTDPGPSVGTGAPGRGPLAGVGSTDFGSMGGVGSTDFGARGGAGSTDFGLVGGARSDELGADASDFGRATSDRGAPMVIRRIVGEVRDPVTAELVDVETVMLCAGPLSVEVCTLGATWRRFDVPCGESTTNILVGPSRWEDLLGPARQHFMGSTIGPVSGRIAGDTFSVDGRDYTVAAEHRTASDKRLPAVHSGAASFAHLPWTLMHTATIGLEATATFGLERPDGFGGFPGEMHVAVTFTLDPDGLTITYQATSNAVTPVAMTNHAYFNLGDGATLEDHSLQLLAASVLAMDDDLVATGELIDVQGSPLDLRWPTPLLSRVRSFVFQATDGIDHSYVLDYPYLDGPPSARLVNGPTGLRLSIFTDQPTIHVYTANKVESVAAAMGMLEPHCGVCFQTQQPNNGVNIERFVAADGATLEPAVWTKPGRAIAATTRFEVDQIPPAPAE